jgi:hypothetical protein
VRGNDLSRRPDPLPAGRHSHGPTPYRPAIVPGGSRPMAKRRLHSCDHTRQHGGYQQKILVSGFTDSWIAAIRTSAGMGCLVAAGGRWVGGLHGYTSDAGSTSDRSNTVQLTEPCSKVRGRQAAVSGRSEGSRAQLRNEIWRKHPLVRVREGVLDAIARTRLLAGHPLWAGP